MEKASSGNRTLITVSAVVTILMAYSQGLDAQTGSVKVGDPLRLDQVIVSATKTEHTLGDVPVAAEVIVREEIEQKQIKSVQEALQFLSGVKVNQTSSGWGDKGKVQMQGLDEKHTLILVDGQRFIGGHQDAVDLQSIPIEMVERIEVVKGPASALYGSDAVGGVVNIITKSPAQKPTISATASAGSRGTQIYDVTGGLKAGQAGGLAHYTYRESDGVNKETDRYREQIFQGSLGYDFSPTAKLTLKPYYSEHKMSYEGRTQERAGVNSSWEWSPDHASKLILRGSLFDYRHATDDNSSNWKTGAYEGEATYSRLLFEKHMVTGGYQYYTEDIDDLGKQYKNDQHLHSFYGQTELSFLPVVLVLGARVDEHDRWGTEVAPKASVLWNLTPALKLRSSVGSAFKAPSLAKLYADNWRMGPYTVYANPDLQPEKSLGYQLGIEYAFLGRFLAKLSVFRNEIKDMIDYKIVSRKMYWQNIDEAVTEGVEMNLLSQWTKEFSTKAGYTYLRTEDKLTGKELTYRPKHKATLELNQRFSAIGLNVSLAGEYIGRRLDSDYNELGGYGLVNAALTQEIGKNFQIFAKANNLFGTENIADEYDLDGARYLVGLKVNF